MWNVGEVQSGECEEEESERTRLGFEAERMI